MDCFARSLSSGPAERRDHVEPRNDEEKSSQPRAERWLHSSVGYDLPPWQNQIRALGFCGQNQPDRAITKKSGLALGKKFFDFAVGQISARNSRNSRPTRGGEFCAYHERRGGTGGDCGGRGRPVRRSNSERRNDAEAYGPRSCRFLAPQCPRLQVCDKTAQADGVKTAWSPGRARQEGRLKHWRREGRVVRCDRGELCSCAFLFSPRARRGRN